MRDDFKCLVISCACKKEFRNFDAFQEHVKTCRESDKVLSTPLQNREANLQRLVERFKLMAKVRFEEADKWRDKKYPTVADPMQSAAEAYDRCACELERVLAGETPPEPGQEWREKT